MRSVILGAINYFILSLFEKYLHVLEEKSYRRDILSREDNFLLKSENYSMKIFNLLYVL